MIIICDKMIFCTHCKLFLSKSCKAVSKYWVWNRMKNKHFLNKSRSSSEDVVQLRHKQVDQDRRGSSANMLIDKVSERMRCEESTKMFTFAYLSHKSFHPFIFETVVIQLMSISKGLVKRTWFS